MPFIKTLGFFPDLDNTTPGVVLDCDGFVPSKTGMRSAYSAADYGADALAANCQGFTVARKTDETTRIIAGTATKLYELNVTTWDDVSRAVGGNYATSTAVWRFCQFGNVTIAANQFDITQFSSSGAFANITGAPKARVVETTNLFVMMGGTNEGTYGEQQDRWWCSALSDYADWTPSIATQCATGRLLDTPGPITAVRALSEFCVFYKQRGIYVATYQGPPTIWSFRLVAPDIGAWSQEAVVKAGNVHYFVGYEDFYRFDGSSPVAIGDGVKEWFFNDLNRDNGEKITGFFDRNNMFIYWFYPSTAGSGTIDKWIAFQPSSGRWGRGSLTVQAAGELLTATPTYDSFGVRLTYDTLPDVGFDSDYWGQVSPSPSVFTTDKKLKTLNGASGTNSITFGFIGDDEHTSTVRRVTPRWKDEPTSATLDHKHSMRLGITPTTDSSVTMVDGRFDLFRTSRWHQEKITAVGDCELSGLNVDVVGVGKE